MSDFKSAFIVFVPADETPPPVDGGVFSDEMDALLSRAHQAGRMRQFATVSYDYTLFLDPFLAAYDLPKTGDLRRVEEADDGAAAFMNAAGCAAFGDVMVDFAARFVADPEIAAALVRAEDDESFVLMGGANFNSPDPFWARKKLEMMERWRLARAREPIDGARMRGLWDANAGQGYLPGDYPKAAEALFTDRPTGMMVSAFQTFGYIKAMRAWCAEAEGMGILEITW